jgi:hypothetical protein
MYTFSDESGRFEESINSDIGIFVIVSLPDSALAKFIEFLVKNFGDKASELKGSKLLFKDRENIIKYIGKHPEIKFSAFVYDHKSTSATAIKDHHARQIKKADESIEKLKPIAVYPTLVPSIELARNQLRKLSEAEYLKVILHTIAFQAWQKLFLFDFMYFPENRDSWEFHHIIDMQNQPFTFPSLVYFLLLGSQNQLSPEPPTTNYPEQWESSHPFFKIYNAEGDGQEEGMLDMRKFYSDFKCADDKKELGLKLPDIISNTLFRSITHPEDISLLQLLKKLWPNRSVVHRTGKQKKYYQVIIFPSEEVKPFASDLIQKHWQNLSKILPRR